MKGTVVSQWVLAVADLSLAEANTNVEAGGKLPLSPH